MGEESTGKDPRIRHWRKHPSGKCGVVGCRADHFCQDMCARHYRRWKRTGSVELAGEKLDVHPAKLNRAGGERRRAQRELAALAASYGEEFVIQEARDGKYARVLGHGEERIRMVVLRRYERVGWIFSTPTDTPGQRAVRLSEHGLGAVRGA